MGSSSWLHFISQLVRPAMLSITSIMPLWFLCGTDFQELNRKSCAKPLEACQLCFYSLDSTSTILLTTDNEQILNRYLLKLHFEKFSVAVQEVKILLPNRAYIYFNTPESKLFVSFCEFLNRSCYFQVLRRLWLFLNAT